MDFSRKSDSFFQSVASTEQKVLIDPVTVQEEGSGDEDFVLVEDVDAHEEVNFEECPWLHPSHPLYFPPTQSIHTALLDRWEAVNKFSVENWYPYLEKYTFKSHFVSLDYNEIQSLTTSDSTEYNDSVLEHKLDAILAQLNQQHAFMRLSTRSPKDSRFLFDHAATIMSNDFVYWKDMDNKNQQLVSFVASMTQAMKMDNGRKIIETIKNSSRVRSDLLVLLNSLPTSKCATQIILREWHPIRPDHEFRVFVSRRGRKESIVTAIAQYFHFLYFDKMPKNGFSFLDDMTKQSLILKVQNYVLRLIDPEIASYLQFSTAQDDDNSAKCIREYIVDLALIPVDHYHGDVTEDNRIMLGGDTYIIVVIELNPFAPAATGSSLFNWKTDLPLLWGKAATEYPVFRERTQPREEFHSVTLLPAHYEQVIQAAVNKRLDNACGYGEIQENPKLLDPVQVMHQQSSFFRMEQPKVGISKEDKEGEVLVKTRQCMK